MVSLAISGKCARSVMQLLNLSLTCIHSTNAAAIYGSNGQSGQGIYSDVINMMASGRIDMRHMVTDRVHLEDIKEGIARAQNQVSGKVLVTHYDRL